MNNSAMLYVVDHARKVLVSIFNRVEGFPEDQGLGFDLYKLLIGRKFVYGRNTMASYTDSSDGIGDLAAQLVWYLKKDSLVGGVYLCDAPQLKPYKWPRALSEKDLKRLVHDSEEQGGAYTYVITEDQRLTLLTVYIFKGQELLYRGSPEGMAKHFGYGGNND